MADPLSIASGIAGLITLAGSIISRCYTYGCGVSGAPKEMKSLVDEVTNLSGLLVGLQGLLNADRLPMDQSETMTRSVKDCQLTLREVFDALDEVKTDSTRQKLGKTVKRLLWPLKREQTLALVQRLERQKNILALALSTDTAASVHETQIVLADMQISLQQDRDEKRSREILEQKRQVLQWLSTVDYQAKHSRASELQHPGTGSWLLKSWQLQSWIEGVSSFLWIYGIPGSGKTVWTSIILNHCILPKVSEKLFAAFFYCDFRDAASETPEAVMGSIIAQLCQHLRPFPREVEETMQRHTTFDGRVTPPSFEELRGVLFHVLDLCPRVLLVIDALDECSNRDVLSRLLVEIATEKTSKVKVLVTSRREIDFERAFQRLPQISIQSKAADHEIHDMIVTTINAHPRFQNLGETLKDFIVSSLSEGAAGMFRWVQCQLDQLARLRTPKAIREAVKSLPRDLNETYARILERIEEDDRLLARRALLWLAYSTRPLSLAELAEAAIFDSDIDELDTETRLKDPEEILEVCGSLTSRTGDYHVILAHNSVREYLVAENAPMRIPYFYFKDGESHIEIAQVCLRYLLLRNFSSGPANRMISAMKRIDEYPLLLYASHNWSEHGLKDLSSHQQLLDLACKLLAPSPPPQFYAWVQALLIQPGHFQRTWDRWPRNATSLYYAASFGLTPVVQRLVEAKVNLDARGGAHGGSALHAACWRRHPEITKILLEAGANPEVVDNQKIDPMGLAEISGDEEIKQLFNDHCGVVLSQNPHGFMWSPRTIR